MDTLHVLSFFIQYKYKIIHDNLKKKNINKINMNIEYR